MPTGGIVRATIPPALPPRMLRPLVACALVLGTLTASPARAQVREPFVESLVAFVRATQGAYGDEGAAAAAALNAMSDALVRWDDAVGRVEAGLRSQIGGAPPDVAARMRTALAAAYLDRARTDAALAELDAAVRLDPQFADAHLLRGLLFEQTDRAAEAAAAYRSFWRARPADAVAAALVLRHAGPGESADLATAEAVVFAAVDRPSVSTGTSVEFPVAGLIADDAVDAPLLPPARYADGLRLVQEGRFEDAIAALTRALQGDPLAADPFAASDEGRRAIAALKAERPADAVESAARAAALWPQSSEAQRVLGLAHWAAGGLEAADRAFDAAARLGSDTERARLSRADVSMAAGNPAAALESLRETIAAVPGSVQAHWRRGRIQQGLGDDAAAIEAFTAVATARPLAGAAQVHAAIGRLRHNRLELEAAASAYEARARATPNAAAAHLDLAAVYRAQDRVDAARREALVAALVEPGRPAALVVVGQMHVEAGRDEPAVAVLRRAIALDPDLLEARYALARALLRMGRGEEARQELAVFETLQSKAMEAERQRYEENLRLLERTLKDGDTSR